jgi:hypothetical protein
MGGEGWKGSRVGWSRDKDGRIERGGGGKERVGRRRGRRQRKGSRSWEWQRQEVTKYCRLATPKT